MAASGLSVAVYAPPLLSFPPGLTLLEMSRRPYVLPSSPTHSPSHHLCVSPPLSRPPQAAGFAHMRVSEGVATQLQLAGLLAKLVVIRSRLTPPPRG